MIGRCAEKVCRREHLLRAAVLCWLFAVIDLLITVTNVFYSCPADNVRNWYRREESSLKLRGRSTSLSQQTCMLALADVHIDPFLAFPDWWILQVSIGARMRFGCEHTIIAGDLMTRGGNGHDPNVSDTWWSFQHQRLRAATLCTGTGDCTMTPGNHDLANDDPTERFITAFGGWTRKMFVPAVGWMFMGGTSRVGATAQDLYNTSVLVVHFPLEQTEALHLVKAHTSGPLLVISGHEHRVMRARHSNFSQELGLPTFNDLAAMAYDGDRNIGFGVLRRSGDAIVGDLCLLWIKQIRISISLFTFCVAVYLWRVAANDFFPVAPTFLWSCAVFLFYHMLTLLAVPLPITTAIVAFAAISFRKPPRVEGALADISADVEGSQAPSPAPSPSGASLAGSESDTEPSPRN